MKATAYLTIDPLNAAEARALADQCGLNLEVVEPRDLPRLEPARFDLVIDWDFTPPELRSALLQAADLGVAAVHGHGLGDDLLGFLCLRGVLTSRHLDLCLFQALKHLGDAA